MIPHNTRRAEKMTELLVGRIEKIISPHDFERFKKLIRNWEGDPCYDLDEAIADDFPHIAQHDADIVASLVMAYEMKRSLPSIEDDAHKFSQMKTLLGVKYGKQ